MYNQYLSDRSSDEKHIFELHCQAARVLTALDSVEYSPYSDWPEPSEEEKSGSTNGANMWTIAAGKDKENADDGVWRT